MQLSPAVENHPTMGSLLIHSRLPPPPPQSQPPAFDSLANNRRDIYFAVVTANTLGRCRAGFTSPDSSPYLARGRTDTHLK